MSEKLSKEEFKKQLDNNADELYKAYLKAEEKRPTSALDILKRADDIRSEFKASDPAFSDEELKNDIVKLEKALNAEQVMLKIGKVALLIAMKSY